MPEFRSIVVGRLSMPAEAPLHLDLNARAKKTFALNASPLKWIVYWKNTQSICVQPGSLPVRSTRSLFQQSSLRITYWAILRMIVPILACFDLRCVPMTCSACSHARRRPRRVQFSRRRIDCDSTVLHYQSKAINLDDTGYAWPVLRTAATFQFICRHTTGPRCISHWVCRIELLWLWVVRSPSMCTSSFAYTYKMTFSITTLFAFRNNALRSVIYLNVPDCDWARRTCVFPGHLNGITYRLFTYRTDGVNARPIKAPLNAWPEKNS